MKRIIFIFFISVSVCVSQNKIPERSQQKIDSLIEASKTSNDTIKINSLNALSKAYYQLNDYEGAMTQAKKNLELLSQMDKDLNRKDPEVKKSLTKNSAFAHYALGNCYAATGQDSLALVHYQTAVQFYKNVNDDSSIATVYGNMGLSYSNLGKNEFAIDYTNKALVIYTKLNNKINMAEMLRGIGNIHQSLGRSDKAIEYYNKALESAIDLKNKRVLCLLYSNMGVAYSEMGSYTKALEFYFRSLKIAESEAYKQETGMVLANIGVVYYKQNNLDKTLEYYFKSLRISDEVNNKNGSAITLGNIGAVYERKDKKEKALECYLKALSIHENMQNKSGIAITLGNLGVLYERMENDTKALEYYSKALSIYEEVQYTPGIIITLGNMGLVYLRGKSLDMSKEERLKKAQPLYLRALDLSKNIGSKDILKEVHANMAEFYKEKATFSNNPKEKIEYLEKTNFHLKQQIDLNDSLFNEQSTQKIAELNLKYETEKKERENKILAQENELQKYELTKKNYFIGAMVFLVVIVVVLTLLFIRQNRLKAAQKNIELEQKLLRTQLNPHFIFNSLNAIQNFIYKNNAQNAADYLSKFATLMRMILNNSREEFVTLEKEISGLNLYLELQALRFNHRFEYEIITDEKIDPSSLAIPPMLAQPFIENAIEHGLLHKGDKGKLTIRFLLHSEHILFEVEDNGVGREKASELRKKSNPEHKPLALTITKERLSILSKGTRKKFEIDILDLKDEKGNALGTKVVFLIPFAEI